LFAITTNSTITKDGRLVMGRGIAQQARDRFPGIDKELASQFTSGARYGLLVSPQWPVQKLAAFQVKIHWRSKASLDLIEYSSACLLEWCVAHPTAQVHLNFPGIGNGRLGYEQVLPFLQPLPDTVTIWQLTPQG
jgi:hypothetical protein